MVDIHLQKLLWVYCPACRSEGKWPSRQTGGQSNPHKWLASRKIWSVVRFETQPTGTKPRASHHRSPGAEARKEEAQDDLPWKDERRPSSVRRTLDPFQRQRWGNFWETWRSAYGLFRSQRYHLELNRTELCHNVKNQPSIYLFINAQKHSSTRTFLNR